MNKPQGAYYKMTKAVVVVIGKYKDEFSDIPFFNDIYASMLKTDEDLFRIVTKQFSTGRITAIGKQNARKELIELTLDIAWKIVVYCNNVKDIKTRSIVNLRKTNLQKKRELDLLAICRNIKETADSLAVELNAYRITKGVLKAYQTCINTYASAIENNMMNKMFRVGSTNELKGLLKVQRENLAKLDAMVEMVKRTMPDFYAEYRSVRKLTKVTRTKECLRVETLDENGDMLANVSLSLKASTAVAADYSSEKAVCKKSKGKGACRFKNMPEGEYLLSASKAGYKSVKMKVMLVNQETLKVKAVLIRIER